MSENAPLVLAETLNRSPVVLRGLTVPEVVVLAMMAVAVWFPTGIIVGAWLWTWMMGLAVAVVFLIATVFLMPLVLERLKRDKPTAYYSQRIRRWATARLGVKNGAFVPRNTRFELGRTYLVSRHD